MALHLLKLCQLELMEVHIDQVHVDIGDVVDKNTMHLELDTRELLLEESNANANKVRYERETKKARSTQARSEMKISQALTEFQFLVIIHYSTYQD